MIVLVMGIVSMSMMVVVAGFAVRVIVGADAGLPVTVDEVESTEEEEAHS